MLVVFCFILMNKNPVAHTYSVNVNITNLKGLNQNILDKIITNDEKSKIEKRREIIETLRTFVSNETSAKGVWHYFFTKIEYLQKDTYLENSPKLEEEEPHLTTFLEELETNEETEEWGVFDGEFGEKAREDGYNLTAPENNPYSVLIITSGETSKALCSGSLVTPQWVLTAAHCLELRGEGVRKVIIFAGGSSKDEMMNMPKTAQQLEAEEWFQHPKYRDNKGMAYDVGVVKTKKNFEMTSSVNTVRLSTKPWKYVGYRSCRITGYGKVYYSKKSPDDYKRKTHYLQVKSPCKCNFRLKQAVGKRFAMRYICSKPKKDFGVCSGDSGGGLVCQGEIRATAMMLVKMVDTEDCDLNLISKYKCGSEQGLTVFQDTCPYLRWVNSHVGLFQEQDISPECKDGSGQTVSSSTSVLFVLSALAVPQLVNSLLQP